ncbi:ABC transporter ATP-binding protein [Microbispora triticiradicis]|uniref:ABC transporter ATP-binding protein n=3 Tax=Microbispora TaxID=2005 RepID=A0ABY3M511_9ACTN|nr:MULTISPECIES: ABC transporter ATP-binding protein [Microbispora]RGA02505.1 ABC transporter ATP-binding protein [Microbispora triticiradicis]TLP66734.1 ABC transporter ATP-binding protein [Microbispora fusca]TYB67450.1 ABC transporter ATP-binding protein [Microbispora tritici]
MAIITVDHLRKTYGARVAVEDVSFSVEEGEVFGIVGRNGAGKTTTVECVAGLRTPTAGTIDLDVGPDGGAGADLKEQVGVQLQECSLPDKIRVGEALSLYASFYRRPADWRALAADAGLDLRASFATLSGGQRQRLSVALALVGSPRVAILDELTTGLDPQARRETWELVTRIRDRGVTVLLVTHFMEEVERLCDRVAVISRGRVRAVDTPAGLVARAGGEQRLVFRTERPLTAEQVTGLRALPEVTSATVEGGDDAGEVTIAGTGDLLSAVTAVLPASLMRGLRMERTTLDDAFLALTDPSYGPSHAPSQEES